MVDLDGGFAEMLESERARTLEVQKIHFSMVGLWANNLSDINRIDDEATILNWFQGVLGHIRTQLEYALN